MRITRFLAILAFVVAGFACADRGVGEQSQDINGDGIPDNCVAYTGGHRDRDRQCTYGEDCDEPDPCEDTGEDQDDDTDTDGLPYPNVP
jgi:hypothetical protein